MDFTQISNALRQGLATVQALAPLAALGGPTVAGAVSIAATLAEIGQNVLEKIEDGQIVATSQDKDQIKAILAEIQAQNDALAARIRTT